MPRIRWLLVIALLLGALLFLLLYRPSNTGIPTVIVYSSVDSEFDLPIFEEFTRETGIRIVYRFDGEETKTTGLAYRLEQMKGLPDGDVFWNSEESLTQSLTSKGVLQPYISPNAQGIPPEFKDAVGMWTGFGCRARVVIFNTNRVKPEDTPRLLEDFANPRWKGRFAVAKPIYGTTHSHLAAAVLEMGEEKAFALFRAWRANGVIIAESNSDVAKRVADGFVDVGLTDSDDAYSALDRKQPVNFIVLDQSTDWPGVFLIPNTVSMLKNCPHPVEARAFIDYLLRPETEKFLAENGAHQIPVREVGAKLSPPFDHLKLKPARVNVTRLGEKVLPMGERILQILSGEEK